MDRRFTRLRWTFNEDYAPSNGENFDRKISAADNYCRQIRANVRILSRRWVVSARVTILHLSKKKNTSVIHATDIGTGDGRVNEQVDLALLHTIWMREHNRIAETMAQLHPQWSDEAVFQETRRIVVAEIQHITYNEFLPIILGKLTVCQ